MKNEACPGLPGQSSVHCTHSLLVEFSSTAALLYDSACRGRLTVPKANGLALEDLY